jgi:hypothetical protein
MTSILAEWQSQKAREADHLHEQIRAAVAAGRVGIVADARVLDFEGSPVHQPWDHLTPLLVLMVLALVILLAAGVAIGIVAMTIGALIHLTGTRYLVAWRLERRTVAFMLSSLDHWQTMWQLGGIAVVFTGSGELPCYAPMGDWRKFARRHLGAEAVPPPPADADDAP